MQVIRKILILIIILTFNVVQASTAGAFLDNPLGAKSHALGGVSVTLIDTSSPFKNPALIEFYKEKNIHLMQGRIFEEVNYLNLSYLEPNFFNSDYGFCFTFLNAGLSGIEEATYDQNTGIGTLTGDTFNYDANSIHLSLSTKYDERINLGTTIKVIDERIANSTARGYGLDIGATYQFADNLLFGASVINLLKPNMVWSTGHINDINSQVILGSNYRPLDNLNLYLDLNYVEKRDLTTHFGIEYYLVRNFALRAGLNQKLITLGLGLSYRNINIDYAYIDNLDSELGSNQYISFSFAFKEPTKEEEEAEELLLKKAISEEQLAEELEKGFAEIEPLPLPEAEEEIPEIAEVTPAVPIEEVVPIIPTPSEEEEVIIYLPEEEIVPSFNTFIQLISARYINSTLQLKVFVDNYGNQSDTVSCNFRLLTANDEIIYEFGEQSETIGPDKTAVFYFYYKAEERLPAGTYYVETNVNAKEYYKYQKEKYIRR